MYIGGQGLCIFTIKALKLLPTRKNFLHLADMQILKFFLFFCPMFSGIMALVHCNRKRESGDTI